MSGGNQERFDVVILGGGSAGELAAGLLGEEGLTVAVVESRLVGGECPYLACMPSKAFLRGAHLRHDLRANGARVGATPAGHPTGEDAAAFEGALRWRDHVADNRDDGQAAAELENKGVVIVRGRGRVGRPGVVEVSGGPAGRAGGDRTLAYDRLLISTGSEPVVPPLDGVDAVDVWTSDDALVSDERPARLVVLGGGAVGCELAQVYARYGSRVTLVESDARPMPPEEEAVGECLARVLEDDGIDLRLGTEARAVRLADSRSGGDGRAADSRSGGDGGSAGSPSAGDGGSGACVVELADGSRLEADRLLVASGRRPRTGEMGFDGLGLDADGPLEIDERCRVKGAEAVWAAGDVTGVAPFTHTANYQARIVVDDILGRRRAADYRAIPRCVFTDPPVASVGMNTRQAREAGKKVLSGTAHLGDTARAAAAGRQTGVVVLVADADDRVLLGASAIGPAADEWIGQATLAVKARVPLDVLSDLVQPFPTYSEIYESALRDLLGG